MEFFFHVQKAITENELLLMEKMLNPNLASNHEKYAYFIFFFEHSLYIKYTMINILFGSSFMIVHNISEDKIFKGALATILTKKIICF